MPSSDEVKSSDEMKPPHSDEIRFQIKSVHIKYLIIALAIVLIIGVGLFFWKPWEVPANDDSWNTAGDTPSTIPTRPTLDLFVIENSSCTQCISLDNLVTSIESLDAAFNKQTLEFSDPKAQELIQTYSVETLPTLVIQGPTSSVSDLVVGWQQLGFGSVEDDNALVSRIPFPPYYSIAENREIGLLSLVRLLDSSCTECMAPVSKSDFESLQPPIAINLSRDVDVNSEEGQLLLAKYAITQVPTIVLTGDIEYYPQFESNLKNLGTIEEDGAFVVRTVLPLYNDLNSGKIIGNVHATYVVDENCTECLQPAQIKDALDAGLGLQITSEETLSHTSELGQSILSSYEFVGLPAVVLHGDMNAYYLVGQHWNLLGSIAEDGNYLFTQLSMLGAGKYKDLNTGEIVEIQPLQGTTA